MITLDYRPDGNFALTAPARYRDYCKQVPGLKFKNTEDAYIGPATWTAAQTIQGVLGSRPEFSITEAAMAHVQHLADEMSSIIKIKRSEELMVAEPFTSRNRLKLFPWQMNDAAVLAHLRQGIDTSDRGTGKGQRSFRPCACCTSRALRCSLTSRSLVHSLEALSVTNGSHGFPNSLTRT